MTIGCEVTSYVIPTDAPEADGTFEWTKTTLVVVRLRAGEKTGLGYTYSDRATATFIDETLAPIVEGAEPMNIRATSPRMPMIGCRNSSRIGWPAASRPSR